MQDFLVTNHMTTSNSVLLCKLIKKSFRSLYPNWVTLSELVAILPTTTAEAEHCFSLINLLCVPLHASMDITKLESLTSLLEEVWDEIVEAYKQEVNFI